MPVKTAAKVRHFHGADEHEHAYFGVHNHSWSHLPSRLPDDYVASVRAFQKLARKVETLWPTAASFAWKVFLGFKNGNDVRAVADRLSVAQSSVMAYVKGLEGAGLLARRPNGTWGPAPGIPDSLHTYADRRAKGGPAILLHGDRAGKNGHKRPLTQTTATSSTTSTPVSAVVTSTPPPKQGLATMPATPRQPRAQKPAKRPPDREAKRARKAQQVARQKTAKQRRASARTITVRPTRRRGRTVLKGVVVLALLGGLGYGAFAALGSGNLFEEMSARLSGTSPAPQGPPKTPQEAEDRFVAKMIDASKDLGKMDRAAVIGYGRSICQRLDEGAPADKLREASIDAGRPAKEYDAFYTGALEYFCPEHAP